MIIQFIVFFRLPASSKRIPMRRKTYLQDDEVDAEQLFVTV